MAYLADVNLVVALLHARHAAAERAARWLETLEEPASVLVCRVVQMGVLRVLTNRAWLQEEVLSAAEVWRAWDLLLTDERFAWVDEPRALERAWRALSAEWSAGRRVETDTYLAAFAVAGRHRVVTFDRGFAGFANLEALILT